MPQEIVVTGTSGNFETPRYLAHCEVGFTSVLNQFDAPFKLDNVNILQ